MAYESEHGLSTGESNNSVSTANLLAENEKTTGALSSSTDTDYYKIVADGPGLIQVTFDTGTYSSTSEHWDIALLSTAGTSYLLSPTASAAGTSVLINGADQTGTSLIVDGLSAAPADGDRFTIGTSTTVYTVVSSGTVSSGEATLTINPSISTAVTDNTALTFDPVQSSVGTTASLTAQVSAAGTYYFKVAKADVSSTQEYGVTATFTSTTEVEDNDDKNDAADSSNYLLEGVSMTGSLSDGNDSDVWLFTTAAASTFSVDFAAVTGTDNQWTITVKDWNGTSILDSTTNSAISLSAGTSASASVGDSNQPQTYQVTVTKHADAESANTGDYTLKVSGTGLDLNDTPSMTIGAVTSDSSNALIDTEVVRSVSAADSGDGEALAMTSLFSASDADSSQTLSYIFTLTQPQVNGGSQTDTTLNVKGLKSVPTAGETFSIATISGGTVSVDSTVYTVVSATDLSNVVNGLGESTVTLDVAVSSPADGSYLTLNSTGFVKVGSTSYGYADGMSSPLNVSLTASEMTSAEFYPGTDTGDFTLYLQAKDDSGANDGSDLGAVMQMTLRSVSAGYAVNVTGADTGTSLQESNTDSSDTITVALGQAPVSGETVTVYLEHDGEEPGSFELDFSTSVLTFTESNFATAQSVTITAREDATKETSQTGKLSFRVVSSDSNSAYNDLAVDTLTYTLSDAANHEPTGSVTLSGTATQGETLTASNDIADIDGLGDITYLWEQSSDGSTGWSTIAGSTTGATYTLTDTQAGAYVRVTASYTDQESNNESVVSSTTAQIANINDAPTLDNGIADQTAFQSRLYSYTFSSDTFSDVDPVNDGGTLTYTVKQVTSATDTAEITDGAINGANSWLIFDGDSRTFSGTVPSSTTEGAEFFVEVTATDNASTQLATTDIFKITVAAAATGTPRLVTALVDQSVTQGSALGGETGYAVSSGSFVDTDDTSGDDAPGNVLTYTATLSDGSALPTWLTFTGATQTFSGTPANTDVGSLSVKVTATDGNGATDDVSDIFDIAVANLNDDPTGAVDANSASVDVTQGNTLTASNTLADLDGIGTIGYQWQSSLDGSTWSAIDGASSSTYQLSQDEVGKVVRVVASYTDGYDTAESVNSSVTAAVANINDAPVAVADTETAVETGAAAAATNPTGNLLINDSDPDTSDSFSITGVNGATGTDTLTRVGDYGTLVLTKATGSYTYTVDDTDTAVQALRTSSNTLSDTFNYTIEDAGGLTSTANLVITVQGANDAPTVANAITAFDGVTNTDNNVYSGNAWTYTFATDVFADVDSGDSLTYTATQSDDSALPSWLSFDAESRTFSTSEAPAAGTTEATVAVKLVASDQGGQAVNTTFNVTVQDTDATAPTLAAPTAITLTDTSADDTLSNTDATLSGTAGTGGGSLTYGISGGTDNGTTATLAGTYGTLVVTIADGNYTFTPDETAVEALAESASESFTVMVTEGLFSASRLLTVNITAANDTPIFAAPTAISLTDTSATDDFVAQLGTLSATDLDSGATQTYGISGGSEAGDTVTKIGTLGTLSLSASTGAYTYTPDDTAVNAAGSDESESFTVTASDGIADAVTQTLTVNVAGADDAGGTNDRPSLTTISTLDNGGSAIAESASLSISYTTLANAADEADDNAVQAFRIMEVTSGTLTQDNLSVIPGTTTIDPNDSPLIWSPSGTSGTVNAFTVVAFDGTLTSLTPVQVKVDVASDENLTSSGTITNTDANEAGVDAEGDVQASVDATGVADALMANITDAGSATMTITSAQTESGSPSAVPTSSTSASNGLQLVGSYGTLTVGADGSYSYVVDQVNATVQALTESQSLSDNFTVTVSATISGTTAIGAQDLIITIDGTNDAIPAGSNDTLTINEDTTTLLTTDDFGTFTDTGDDAETLQMIKITSLPAQGALEYDSGTDNWGAVSVDQMITAADITAGKLRFVPGGDGNGSGYAIVGYQVGDSDAYSSSTYTLTVDVTAVADATLFGGALTGAATEDLTTAAIGGTLTASDADDAADAVITPQTDTAGTYGTFSIADTGIWSYTLDNTSAVTQTLASAATATDTFSVAVAGGDAQNVVMTVTGVNDAPTGAATTISVAANNAHTFTASDFSFTDVDTGDSLGAIRIDSLSGIEAADGTLQLDGVDVTETQVIELADLGNLVFTAGVGVTGLDYANFTYSVRDSSDFSAAASTMTINEGYTLTGAVEFWKDSAVKLEGVGLTVVGQNGTSAATTGAFSVEAIADADGEVDVTASLAGPENNVTSGLSLTDVLAGLKLYLGKSLPESYSSPYNYIAADFDADNDVDLSDVLNMLKYYLGKSTTNNVEPEWAFVDKADFTDDVVDTIAGADGNPLSKLNTTPHTIDQDISVDGTIELVGVLRGDVDGSWVPVTE